MTTTLPSVEPQAPQAPTTRQYIRYLFYKARPSWRQLAREERAAACAELLGILEPFVERLAVLRAYSTLGTRGDADFVFWSVSERLEDFQELNAAVRAVDAPLRAQGGPPRGLDADVRDDGWERARPGAGHGRPRPDRDAALD